MNNDLATALQYVLEYQDDYANFVAAVSNLHRLLFSLAMEADSYRYERLAVFFRNNLAQLAIAVAMGDELKADKLASLIVNECEILLGG